MARFPPDIYARYRPEYPRALFDQMMRWRIELRLPSAMTVADVGCGNGQATKGLLEYGVAEKAYAVEIDPGMLELAKHRLAGFGARVTFVCAPGEATTLSDRSVDAVTSVSAFHWMERDEATTEFLRILKRPGLVFLAEYGFPVSQSNPDLNSWIRSKLKGEWEIPELKDRVSFTELVSGFGRRAGARELGVVPVSMIDSLDAERFAGLVRSQSRYVRFRSALDANAARALDEETLAKSKELMRDGEESFDFRLQAAGFFFA